MVRWSSQGMVSIIDRYDAGGLCFAKLLNGRRRRPTILALYLTLHRKNDRTRQTKHEINLPKYGTERRLDRVPEPILDDVQVPLVVITSSIEKTKVEKSARGQSYARLIRCKGNSTDSVRADI